MPGSVPLLLSCEEPAWEQIAGQDVWTHLFLSCIQEVFKETHWQHDSAISCLLTNDTHIQGLNSLYRHKNIPTNVLSFPLLEFDQPTLPKEDCFEYNHLGDVVLSFETIQRESGNLGLLFQDHTLHLFTHGLLHLLGYDHEEDCEARVMEGLETSILQNLGLADPYAVRGEDDSAESERGYLETTSFS